MMMMMMKSMGSAIQAERQLYWDMLSATEKELAEQINNDDVTVDFAFREVRREDLPVLCKPYN